MVQSMSIRERSDRSFVPYYPLAFTIKKYLNKHSFMITKCYTSQWQRLQGNAFTSNGKELKTKKKKKNL